MAYTLTTSQRSIEMDFWKQCPYCQEIYETQCIHYCLQDPALQNTMTVSSDSTDWVTIGQLFEVTRKCTNCGDVTSSMNLCDDCQRKVMDCYE